MPAPGISQANSSHWLKTEVQAATMVVVMEARRTVATTREILPLSPDVLGGRCFAQVSESDPTAGWFKNRQSSSGLRS